MGWLKDHETLLWAMVAFSVISLVAAVILLPTLLARIPADYFVRKAPPPGSWRGRHPLLRALLRAGKNVLGVLLVAIGIPLVPLPGQGFLTILAGLALLDFPGKRRLELRVIRVPGILSAANWLRERAGRPPLETEGVGPGEGEAGSGRTFDHGADIGVLGEGPTLEQAFAGAARAMFSVIVDLSGVAPREAVEISCTASDPELLLVKWLNALLAEADLRAMAFCEFQVRFVDGGLVATARGEPLDPGRHARGVEVKGATLTELEVARENGLWRAQTVVDV
jgi:SHS2 domain-containing protein